MQKLAGLSTGLKTTLATSIKNGLKVGRLKDFFLGNIFAFISVGIEIIASSIDFFIVRCFTNILGAILWEGIKILGSMLITAILAPFLGPFAWLVDWLLGRAVDILDAI